MINHIKADGSNHGNHIDRKERHYPFEGIQNFRDLGGYATKDGRRTKWGVLYRSGQLSALSPKDQVDFAAFDIGLICDFRWEGEQHRAPTRLAEPHRLRICNLPINTGSFRSFFESIGVREPSANDMLTMLKEIYRTFVNEHARTYADMFLHLRDAEKGSLIHCTAGKDRTGFGTALILAALGVDRETIMEDYLLSMRYFSVDSAMAMVKKDGETAGRLPYDPAVLRPVYEVHPEYLETAFDEMEKHFHSVDGYLEKAIGLSGEMRDGLKNKYLE